MASLGSATGDEGPRAPARAEGSLDMLLAELTAHHEMNLS
jgi:hypothetical protein